MKSVNRFAAVALGCCLFAAPALAQDSGGQPSHSIQNGNTTIVFQPADSSDLNMAMYNTWNGFAQAHPDIVRQLSHKPWMMANEGYLKRHPELEQFFEQHPDIQSAMVADPGNFLPV
jgi:hypothetical protein